MRFWQLLQIKYTWYYHHCDLHKIQTFLLKHIKLLCMKALAFERKVKALNSYKKIQIKQLIDIHTHTQNSFHTSNSIRTHKTRTAPDIILLQYHSQHDATRVSPSTNYRVTWQNTRKCNKRVILEALNRNSFYLAHPIIRASNSITRICVLTDSVYYNRLNCVACLIKFL